LLLQRQSLAVVFSQALPLFFLLSSLLGLRGPETLVLETGNEVVADDVADVVGIPAVQLIVESPLLPNQH
jgi:hypothetical protein